MTRTLAADFDSDALPLVPPAARVRKPVLATLPLLLPGAALLPVPRLGEALAGTMAFSEPPFLEPCRQEVYSFTPFPVDCTV